MQKTIKCLAVIQFTYWRVLRVKPAKPADLY